MAQFFSAGDLRETAKPVVVVDWETGDALGSVAHPEHVQGTLTLDDGWTVDTLLNQVLNAADKWFTVPGNRMWQILSVGVTVATSATVGNRCYGVMWTDENGVELGFVLAGVTQAASLTYHYTFAPSLADLSSTRGTATLLVNGPLPSTLILTANYRLRVFDNEAIATAQDDVTVNILYAWKEL